MMDDLINRAAAIEAIEKHIRTAEEPYQLTDADTIMNHAFEIAASCIYNLSATEPEIIRCKDCKYWQDQEEEVVEVPICARPENKYEKFPFVMLIGGDGFCSYAERKENR